MRKIVFEASSNGITVDRIIRDYEYKMPTKHLHDEFEIYYLLEGERYYFIEHKSYHVKKGNLVFVNHGMIHKTDISGKPYHDRMLIEFNEEPFSTFFSSVEGLNVIDFFNKLNGILELNEQEQKHIVYLISSMYTEMHAKSIGYQTSVMMKLANLLIFSMRSKTEKSKSSDESSVDTNKHRKVDEVASYIVKHCTETISLDNIATSFYVNKCYLSRIFKEVTGFTVNEYINIHRIQKAQTLLTDTDMNITEIADSLGYESITYFEKIFKKFHETSPLKYRKNYQKKVQHIRSKKNEDVV